MKKLILVLLLLPFMAAAQQFPADGVYCSFPAFRNNKPDLVKEQLIKSVYNTEFTIRQWSGTEDLYYTRSGGEKASLSRDSIWGFAENGVVYIYLGHRFHKIHTLGQISYFLESYPIIKGNMAPVVTETRATSSYRLLDMETGDLYDYRVETLSQLLAPDEAIFNEYKAITSLKSKRKKMYLFLEKFNKAHPLQPWSNSTK